MHSQFLTYARLLRLPNVFTAMADIALGALVTGALLERWPAFLCLLIASSALYCSGMVWNDIFDIEQDRRERPFRPLPSGRVSARSASLLAGFLMVIGVGAAVAADLLTESPRWSSTIIAVCLAGMVLLYDRWAKRTWIGPVAMGGCRALNVLLGLSVSATGIPPWGSYLAIIVGLYIVGVTWFARTEARASNQQALQAATALMLVSLILALAVPVVAANSAPSPLFPYLLVAFGFYLALPIHRALSKPIPAHVQAAVKRSVLGLVLLDALLATAVVGVTGLAIVLLLAPALWLGKWVYST